MSKTNMIERLRNYTTKYGAVEGWSLALKFHVLFETMVNQCGADTMNSIFVSTVYNIVTSFAKIENSGVVDVGYKVKDRSYSDTAVSTYKCGKYTLEFTEYTRYKKDYIDTEWYLDVKSSE